MFDPTSETISFAEFEIDRVHRRLLSDGKTIPLYAKAYDLLEFFVERNGRIVAKDEILESVWPGQIVEEANLTVQVSALRKALGEQKGSPRFLITIPGKGYKFAADINGSGGSIVVENHKYSRSVVEEEFETDDVPASAGKSNARQTAGFGKLVLVAISFVVVAAAAIATYSFLNGREAPVPFREIKISRLTNSGDIAGSALSPDGKFIAYILKEPDGNGLWLRQIGTASDVRVLPPTDSEFWGLIFSPDGEFIYYNIFARDKADIGVFRVPKLGGVIQEISGVGSFGLTFSPDGKQITYVRRDSVSKANGVMIANNDGSEQREIARRPFPETYQFEGTTAAWSPDGKSIATIVNRRDDKGNYSSIVGLALADGREYPLSADRWYNVSHLEWLQDGSSGLVITSTERVAGAAQVWFLSAYDGKARRIINDLSDYGWLSVAASGQAFAAVQSSYESGIWIQQADSDEFREIASEVGDMSPLVWLGDGRIVFRSHRDGEGNLWSINSDGTGLSQLTVGAGVDSRGMCATPDGKFIVFTSTRSGRSSLWRVGSGGEKLTELTDGEADAFPQCASDGRTVIFQRGIYSKPELWTVQIEGGEPSPIGDRGGKWPALSPEGGRISFFQITRDEWHIVVRPTDRQTELHRLLVPKNLRESTTVWASPAELYYIGDVGNLGNIWSQPINGGEPRQITKFSDRSISGFALSPDRRRLAVVRTEGRSDVILVNSLPRE